MKRNLLGGFLFAILLAACAAQESKAPANVTPSAPPDEQKQCDEARDKLKSSKDRVRSTCGECSH